MDQAMRPRLIAHTAWASKMYEIEVSAGIMFDQVVEKSFDFDGLMQAVDRLLRGAPNPMTRRALACTFPLEN